MIPTVILLGLVLGLTGRWWMIPLLGVAWALLIVGSNGDVALFPGAFAFGAANAAAGCVFGIGARTIAQVCDRRINGR